MPENLPLGVSLIEEGSLTLLVAIFVSNLPESLVGAVAFAGGAVLASLADTLMPEAFEHGRPWNSFATATGFFLAFMLATL